MPRIAIYHWLPVASNMLLRLDFSGGESIEEKLRQYSKIDKVNIDTSTHSLSYHSSFEFKENGVETKLPVVGNMNQRGFNQCVLDLPATAISTAGMLRIAIPDFSAFVTDMLYSVLPRAAQNNCAVLHEGIVGYEEFSSRPFDEATEAPAKKYLSAYKLVTVMLGRDDLGSVRTGFSIQIKETHHNPTKPDSIQLQIPPFDPSAHPFDELSGVRAHVSDENNCVLFLSNRFSSTDDKFDHSVYKYAALIAFSATTSRAIGILRNVRSHIPPLRRELAVALQHNTMLDEDFSPMVKISRYLSYVNLKLPVIQTVKNYLLLAAGSSEFKEKVKTFAGTRVHDHPEIEAIHDAELDVHLILRIIEENLKRLENLFIEEKDEIQTFSDEISRHLQITLASQDIQLSTRELEAAETSRELDRGGKNRANALKGLSIVLAANLGLQLVEVLGLVTTFGRFGIPSTVVKLSAFLVVPLLAWLIIDRTIQQKSSHMRMVMEIKRRMLPQQLSDFVEQKTSKRIEIEGSRRLQTWTQDFQLSRPLGNSRSSSSLSLSSPLWRFWRNNKKDFDVTIDYENTGLIHAITLETEYDQISVDQSFLVQQVIAMLNDAKCINAAEEKETSLLAQVLLDLGISLNRQLPALNYVLAYRRNDLGEMLSGSNREGFVGFLTDEQRIASVDLLHGPQRYVDWMKSISDKEPELAVLLGKENLRLKTRLLEDSNPTPVAQSVEVTLHA